MNPVAQTIIPLTAVLSFIFASTAFGQQADPQKQALIVKGIAACVRSAGGTSSSYNIISLCACSMGAIAYSESVDQMLGKMDDQKLESIGATCASAISDYNNSN